MEECPGLRRDLSIELVFAHQLDIWFSISQKVAVSTVQSTHIRVDFLPSLEFQNLQGPDPPIESHQILSFISDPIHTMYFEPTFLSNGKVQ